MAGVKTEDGVVHVPSDGYDDGLGVPPNSPWYALCDVAEMNRTLFEPGRQWKESDIVDEHVTCLECIGYVREAITPVEEGQVLGARIASAFAVDLRKLKP